MRPPNSLKGIQSSARSAVSWPTVVNASIGACGVPKNVVTAPDR